MVVDIHEDGARHLDEGGHGRILAVRTTLAGARLYLLDDDDKIKEEQVIFFVQG